MSKERIRMVITLAVLAGAVGLAGSQASAGGSGAPATLEPATVALDPGSFVTVVDNPYYPLTPGTTLVYEGVRDGQTQIDRVRVTDGTKTILGIRATVVLDVARHGDMLLEKTHDWFAQDVEGNVWYLGEDTAEYDPQGNVVSTEGSWQAGVDGAEPGIIMEADPQVADGYRQEYLAGHAEDQAWILTRSGSVVVPFGRLHRTLLTMEWSPLEPDVVDQKTYAPGIGIVSERTIAGGQEVAELVAVHTG
jgi:hypothetical protein